MACLEMYNDDRKKGYEQFTSFSPMSPRISFSNDFVEINPDQNKLARKPLSIPEGSSSSASSSFFEFSVSNQSMVSADQLFSKGKILPFKETNQRTLREELLAEEEDSDGNDDEFLLRPSSSKIKGKWKGFLGLNKAQIGTKKTDKTNAAGLGDNKIDSANKSSQEMQIEGEIRDKDEKEEVDIVGN